MHLYTLNSFFNLLYWKSETLFLYYECSAELTLEPEKRGNSIFSLFVSALTISENWLYSGQFCYNALVFNVDTHKSWVIFLNVFLASSIQWGISVHNFLVNTYFQMSMVYINECCQFIVILGLFFIIVLYFLLCPVKPVYKLQRNNGGIWGDLGCWSFYHLLVSWISFMKQKKWTCFRDTCEHTRVHEVSVESLLMS